MSTPENPPPGQHKPSSPRRIPASRAAAARNFKHGMLAQTVVLESESKPRFEELVDDLIAEHRPVTKSEQALVETMAVARWRQMRTWSMQKNDLEREIAKHQSTVSAPMAAAIAFRALSDNSNSLSTGLRYETAYERQFKSALREFNVLKDKRGSQDDEIPQVPFSMASSTWDAESFAEEDPGGKVILPFDPNPTNEHSQELS
jgi:hypothetical protein